LKIIPENGRLGGGLLEGQIMAGDDVLTFQQFESPQTVCQNLK